MLKSTLRSLSEITDIDNRIFRTVIDLFRKPNAVVEAYLIGQKIYVRPLRYALSTSSLFIVAQYLYDLFITNIEIGKWWLPIRLDQADERFGNLFEATFPFQILITAIPLAIVIFRILFYKRSWKEATVVMLYAMAQFWLLMTLCIPVLISMEAMDGLIALGCFVVVFISFRNVMYGHVLVRMGKWLLMISLLIIWFYEVSLSITEYVLTAALKGYSPAVLTSPVAEPLKTIDLQAADIVVIQRDPYNRVMKLNTDEKGIKAMWTDNKSEREVFFPGIDHIRKAMYVTFKPQVHGFLVLTDSARSGNSQGFLVSAEGKIIFHKIYREQMVLNGGGLLNGNTLFLGGGRIHDDVFVPFIDVITLSGVEGELIAVSERNLLLLNPRQRFEDIYPVDTAKNLTLVASKYESTLALGGSAYQNEITSFSVLKIRLDSAIVIEWENEIFRKNSMYSPMRDEAFRMILDTANQRILVTYALSDDSILATYLFNINSSGNVVWEKKISENNITFITSLFSDASGIYISGSTASGIGNPITFSNRQGLFGHVSADGKKIRMSRYGRTRHGWQTMFSKIVPGDSITVYSDEFSLRYLGPEQKYNMLIFKNDFAEK